MSKYYKKYSERPPMQTLEIKTSEQSSFSNGVKNIAIVLLIILLIIVGFKVYSYFIDKNKPFKLKDTVTTQNQVVVVDSDGSFSLEDINFSDIQITNNYDMFIRFYSQITHGNRLFVIDNFYACEMSFYTNIECTETLYILFYFKNSYYSNDNNIKLIMTSTEPFFLTPENVDKHPLFAFGRTCTFYGSSLDLNSENGVSASLEDFQTLIRNTSFYFKQNENVYKMNFKSDFLRTMLSSFCSFESTFRRYRSKPLIIFDYYKYIRENLALTRDAYSQLCLNDFMNWYVLNTDNDSFVEITERVNVSASYHQKDNQGILKYGSDFCCQSEVLVD